MPAVLQSCYGQQGGLPGVQVSTVTHVMSNCLALVSCGLYSVVAAKVWCHIEQIADCLHLSEKSHGVLW